MITLTQRLTDHTLAIFLFHGVIEKNNYQVRNYTRKHLEKDYFAKIISELKVYGRPLSMDDVIDHIQTGEPFPPRSFAVTFDDGFENNYSMAAPLLAEMNIPAVFYLSTDFIENNTMSWIDRIEYCLEQIVSGSLRFSWDDEEFYFRSPLDKIRILDEIRLKAKQDPSIKIGLLVESVFEQCRMKPIEVSGEPVDKKMSWVQVRELAKHPNFLVGGHTHTHAIMSFLNEDELEEEISTSLKLLRHKGGVEPCHYSYPEGLAHNYSENVIYTLKRHGIRCCPTALDGLNRVSDSLFHLKRITVT